MNNKYKIIFVDIDWTILDHKIHDWDYYSINALKKMQEEGMLVYLCTARPYDSVVHTGIFNFLSPDGVISTNGGVAFVGDEVLFSNEIPEEIVKAVEDSANKHNLVVEMCTDRGRFFSNDVNEWVENYFKSYAETVPPIAEGIHKNVSAMLLFAPEFMDEELIKELPPEIRYYRFDLYGVDLCYFANDKGKAIKKVLEALHIDKSASIGAGDDYGDIPMFEEVGLSIAMGNGKKDAIDKATYKALTIHEHGLGKALKDLGIIPFDFSHDEISSFSNMLVKNNKKTKRLVCYSFVGEEKHIFVDSLINELNQQAFIDLRNVEINDFVHLYSGVIKAIANDILYIDFDDKLLKIPLGKEYKEETSIDDHQNGGIVIKLI